MNHGAIKANASAVTDSQRRQSLASFARVHRNASAPSASTSGRKIAATNFVMNPRTKYRPTATAWACFFRPSVDDQRRK